MAISGIVVSAILLGGTKAVTASAWGVSSHSRVKRNTHPSERSTLRQVQQIHTLLLAINRLKTFPCDSQTDAARRIAEAKTGSVVSHLQMKISIIGSGRDSNFAPGHPSRNSVLDRIVH